MVHDLLSRYGTHLKLVAVVFVGIHVPLVLAGIAWLGTGLSDPRSLMLAVLVGTVAGLLISISGIWVILRSQIAVLI
jgi:hypothetical protein